MKTYAKVIILITLFCGILSYLLVENRTVKDLSVERLVTIFNEEILREDIRSKKQLIREMRYVLNSFSPIVEQVNSEVEHPKIFLMFNQTTLTVRLFHTVNRYENNSTMYYEDIIAIYDKVNKSVDFKLEPKRVVLSKGRNALNLQGDFPELDTRIKKKIDEICKDLF